MKGRTYTATYKRQTSYSQPDARARAEYKHISEMNASCCKGLAPASPLLCSTCIITFGNTHAVVLTQAVKLCSRGHRSSCLVAHRATRRAPAKLPHIRRNLTAHSQSEGRAAVAPPSDQLQQSDCGQRASVAHASPLADVADVGSRTIPARSSQCGRWRAACGHRCVCISTSPGAVRASGLSFSRFVGALSAYFGSSYFEPACTVHSRCFGKQCPGT